MSSQIMERLARVVPPRIGSTNASAPWYAFACNGATAPQQLNTTIFQIAGKLDSYGNATAGLPGNYGKGLLRVQAEGADLWILFGSTNAVQANSATTGANAAMHIPVNQERDFEVDPSIDLFLSAVTQNGASQTGTCRMGIVSFRQPGPQGT